MRYVYHISANTQNKKLFYLVSITLIYRGFSKRRIHHVAAKQVWFQGTNIWSKLHSCLHHRLLLNINCTQQKETHPISDYVALNLTSKVAPLGLHFGNENLPVGTLVPKELFASRWVGDIEWLMARQMTTESLNI